MPSTVRILVVEDYEPFRQWVCSTLEQRPEWQVVGEASDGLEAVEKAATLRPDIVLLDIGLPTQDGFRAARQIRKRCPETRILFLSQYSSSDAIEEALSLGALGYVVKTHAGRELLVAIDAVCSGRPFVTQGWPATKEHIARRHEVHFHSDDEPVLASFARFIGEALEGGKAVVVLVTEAHRQSLGRALQGRGVDTACAAQQGRYILLDVAETLATFMIDDMPDEARFRKVTRDLFAAAARAAIGKPPPVAACGECAPTLWAQGKPDAAVRLEHLWDEFVKTYEVDTLCGYVLNDGQRQQGHVYERICAEHSAVY